jgi:hypothetical protein
MSVPLFDATVEYDEETKDVSHDISIHMRPRTVRKPKHQEKRKVRERVTRRVFAGYVKKRGGGFVSKAYAKRYPHLVKRAYRVKVTYRTVEKTVNVGGGKYTEADAFKALWAAHKITQHGGKLDEMREWEFEAIDWRKSNSGEYHYQGDRVTEVIANLGGILEDKNTVVNIHLRVGVVDEGPEE